MHIYLDHLKVSLNQNSIVKFIAMSKRPDQWISLESGKRDNLWYENQI